MNRTKMCVALMALFIPLCAPQDAKGGVAANVDAVGPSTPVAAGQQFDITINVNPNNNVAGAQFSLSFDPSLVSVTGVSEGTLLKQSGAATYFAPGKINNQTGTVVGVAGAIVTPGKTVSVSGTFAVLTMTAKSLSGTSPLNLSNVIVGDATGIAVSVNIANGQVVISGGASSSVAPPPPVTWGSGGSFGGGGSIPVALGVTNLVMYTNGSGLFNLSATATSEDGNAELDIDKGVQANAKDGSPVKSVSILKATDAGTALDGQTLVGSAYDFGPDGAVFNPPVVLSLTFDPSLVPPGLVESSLFVAVWDTATGRWSKIDSQVDGQAHIARAAVTHFSRYTVIAQARPASFIVTGLKMSAPEVSVDDPVTVTVTVSNGGDVSGKYDVTLSVSPSGGGSGTLRQAVEVPGGASKDVVFNVTEAISGQFLASAGDLSGNFTVRARPAQISAPAVESSTPRIRVFDAALNYGRSQTPGSIWYAYELVNPGADRADAKLIATISFDGRALDEVPLFSGDINGSGEAKGSLDYFPSRGLENGTYRVRAELYTSGSLVDSSAEQLIEIQNRQPPTVSWHVLASIIGSSVLASFVVTVLILGRRRAFLGSWTSNSATASQQTSIA